MTQKRVSARARARVLERAEAAGPPTTSILTCIEGVRPTLDELRDCIKASQNLKELESIRIELLKASVHCEARMRILQRKAQDDWMREDTDEDRMAIRGASLENTSLYCSVKAAMLRAHLRGFGLCPRDIEGNSYGEVVFKFKARNAHVRIHALEVGWPALLTSCMHLGPEGQVVSNRFANVNDLVAYLQGLGAEHGMV